MRKLAQIATHYTMPAWALAIAIALGLAARAKIVRRPLQFSVLPIDSTTFVVIPCVELHFHLPSSNLTHTFAHLLDPLPTLPSGAVNLIP